MLTFFISLRLLGVVTHFQVLSVLSHKRELLKWRARSLWTHDKISKAIGAEHIQFHDLRYAFAALSLKSGADVKPLFGGAGPLFGWIHPSLLHPYHALNEAGHWARHRPADMAKTAGPAFARSAVCLCSDLPVSLFSKPFSAQDFHPLHAVPPEQLQRFRTNSLTGHCNGDRRRTPHGRGAADPAQ